MVDCFVEGIWLLCGWFRSESCATLAFLETFLVILPTWLPLTLLEDTELPTLELLNLVA